MPRWISQLHAVGLALVAYTCWVLADTCLKIAGATRLPAYEILGIVGAAEVLLLLLLGVWKRSFASLRPRQPGRQLLRSCLDLANNLCVVIALRHLSLPLFYILIFFAPILTTVLSAIFLHESIAWKKGLAILAGFAGVVVAVNPFDLHHAGDVPGYCACLVCVSCFSVNIVWSRVLAQTETPQSLTFASGLLMAVVGGAGMLHHAASAPASVNILLGGTGLFCIVGSYCFFLALRHAPAATVSQFHYSQLVTGTGVAWLIWREKLTVSMLLGAALIIGAGAFTAASSYRLGRRKEAPPQLS